MLGIECDEEWNGGIGSTDMGNVSQVVPSIHAYIAICGENETTTHTKESAKAAISPQGHKIMIQAAKALAMTTVDLLTQPQLMKRIKKDFSRT